MLPREDRHEVHPSVAWQGGWSELLSVRPQWD